MVPTAEIVALARTVASAHGLDPALVCAVVEQESSWDAHAIRYEPGFRARYVVPLELPPSEETAPSISRGLLQVMGQVVREHGFQRPFLGALCDSSAGLTIGCIVLAAKLAAAGGKVSRGLALWNGSRNLDYAAQVLARLPRYRSRGRIDQGKMIWSLTDFRAW